MASKRHARAPTADIIMGWVDPWVWFGLVAELSPLEDRRRPKKGISETIFGQMAARGKANTKAQRITC